MLAARVEPRPTAWRRWGWLVRWLGTAAGVGYVLTLIDPADARQAAARLSAGALALAVALVAANVLAGAVRWRVLLRAYGAQRRPGLAHATYLYFIAFFFNNFLPGAVAGDVVRGVATRDGFEEGGATAGLSVVLVERALGLFGLFLLLAIGLSTADRSLDTGSLWAWSAAGIAGSLALVLALPFARRIAPWLPAPLRGVAARVPELRVGGAFVTAAMLSVGTQALIAAAGHVLLVAVEPSVDLGASLLVVPLAAATTFLPITVGGAGAREAVYVTLGASLFGISRADALAASLALWLAHLLVGALGGAMLLARRSSKPVSGAT